MEFFPPAGEHGYHRTLATRLSFGMTKEAWCTVPASLASSSFGTPLIFVCLTAEHFLLSWDCALNFTQFMMLSTIPQEVAYGEHIFNNEYIKYK